ncbi:hypothetical protein [Streptomyces californicus]|uniref:hypothetical protein n=1 Tax=Streptomyces californicus TaxID=67351 RepID=UPI00378DB7BC
MAERPSTLSEPPSTSSGRLSALSERPSAPAVFVRRWLLHRLAAAALVTGCLWTLVPTDRYDVPARDGVQAMLWPLAPALFTAVLPVCLGTAAGPFERTVRRPGRLRLLVAGAAVALASGVALCGAAVNPAVAFRNTALLVGLAFLGTVVLPAGAAWTPAVFVPVVMWLTGTRATGRAYPWATLLAPPASASAGALSAVVLVAGVAAYVARGPAPVR